MTQVNSEVQLRRHALRIFRAALDAADPGEAILRRLRRYNLRRFQSVFVVGAGKAGASMAAALERVPGLRIAGGLVNVKYGHTARLRRVELCECGHPVPDENGLAGAKRIAEIARQAGSRDLLLGVISGGASALLPLPADGISLADKQAATEALLACGADIHELNTIRKHLSAIKGGQLARLAWPATVITLVLSDVIGDDLDVIGSGPTVPDRSTFAQALAIVRRYGLVERVPGPVRERLERGAAGGIEETPRPGDPAFARVRNVIVGSNRIAVDAAARASRALGYRTLVLSTMVEGETREVARVHAAIAREMRASGHPVKPPACLISGGETTVTLCAGHGMGGRNQEFVLAAARAVAGMENVVVLSAGTDGGDGPTDAAGAIADGRTVARASEKGLNAAEALARNDSYHFFEPLGDLIRTGPTGTNVMDVHVVMVG
jgi:hydroxypyruvate reductase